MCYHLLVWTSLNCPQTCYTWFKDRHTASIARHALLTFALMSCKKAADRPSQFCKRGCFHGRELIICTAQATSAEACKQSKTSVTKVPFVSRKARYKWSGKLVIHAESSSTRTCCRWLFFRRPCQWRRLISDCMKVNERF